MTNPTKTKRNAMIASQYRAGQSMAHVGRNHGLTRMAIHSILKKLGVNARSNQEAAVLAYGGGRWRSRDMTDRRQMDLLDTLFEWVFVDGTVPVGHSVATERVRRLCLIAEHALVTGAAITPFLMADDDLRAFLTEARDAGFLADPQLKTSPIQTPDPEPK